MEVFVQNSSIYCIFWLPSVTDRFNPNIQFPDRICYSDTLVCHLAALDTLGGELVFIAAGAVDVILLGDEALGADGVAADTADEAALVPLPRLVLHLLHARLHQPRRQLGQIVVQIL